MQTGFVIPGGDRAEALHALEEVFHAVTEAIPATVKGHLYPSGGQRRNAGLCPATSEVRPQPGAVVALVGDDPFARRRDDGLGNPEIRALPRINPNLQRSASSIHQGGELGVESSLGATNALKTLASDRVRSVLVELDVCGVQMPKLSLGTGMEPAQHRVPNAEPIPSAPAGVDAFPRTEDLRQIAPGAAGAESEDHRLDHAAMAARRTTTRRYRYRARMAFLNFFNRSQSESRRKIRGPDGMVMTPHSDCAGLHSVHSPAV